MTVVTKCASLRAAFDAERRNLFDSAAQVGEETFEAEERSVPMWVRLVVAVARNFF